MNERTSNNQATNNTDAIKKHKIFRNVFSAISILGLIDIATRSQTSNPDIGLVSSTIGQFISAIFGINAGVTITGIVRLIIGLTVIWIAIAIYEYWKVNKLSQSGSVKG